MSSTSLYITDQFALPPAVHPGWPRGLPAPLTRLVGRAGEIEDVERLLRRTRLLTLTGAGGSGKTRLALEVAARVAARSADGIGWVELGSMEDPRGLAHHVVVTIGAGDEPGRSSTAALVEALRDRATLLVLDNCEHLLDACAELVDALLRGCPRLAVLATSRQALGVAGETAWLVPPLAVPESEAEPADRLATRESVQLFVDRARAAHPAFALSAANASAVAHICRRLEGMPLAIELAAARVRSLSAEQIAARLDDAFHLLTVGTRTALPRHRTLRGVMDWSYALLTAPEQRLLERLSVFVGGFTLEHAERVCADEAIAAPAVLDLVAALVDKSLVVVGETNGAARYRLLETVRQYARERLRARGEEEALRRRRADHFLALAEEAAPRLVGGAREPPLVARLAIEDGNFRAVAEWCERDESRTAIALRLGTALHWLWFARGQFRDGCRRLAAALERDGRAGDVPPLVRAAALNAYASVLIWQGNYALAPRWLEEAIVVFRREGDDAGLAYALADLGAATALSGDPRAAAPVLEEAAALARTLEGSAIATIALYWRGLAAQMRGDVELGRASFEEALAIGRALGDPPTNAHPMYRLGWLECDLGRWAEARALFLESLARLARMDDRWGAVQVLDGLACVSLGGGEPARAARLLAAAETLREGHGIALPAEWRATHERLLAACRRSLGDDALEVERRAGRALTFEQIVAEAMLVPADGSCEADGCGGAASSGEPASAGAATPAAPGRAADAAPALRVLALGPLQVIRDGELLGPEAWGSAKARELLLFLLCHPAGRTREQVGVALWPDASSAKLRNIFHVTLHRLRRALGRADWIGLAGDRYLMSPALGHELDATIFERDAHAALRELKRNPGAAGALREALALYRGDFLATELVGDWHLEIRERLARLCVDALLALGGVLLGEERHAEAADVFRRVLERDVLHEDAYRRLMLCHARLGERPQAIRLYQRLERLLRDELDTAPAPETARLHERLQRGAEP